MDTQTQSVALSKDPDTEGFDLEAGKSWIYPTNYPTREYQFNIIQEALLKNTLVSLPTGLGKTFIAAVVMYNFYRWYPHGKIVFMAPTKPLVKQQVEACYNIMAIPNEVTAELTGSKVSSSRSNIWLDKRVFFVTPQVLQNDLEKVSKLGATIKCLVFDEAHKAKGNHAYCEVIRILSANNHKFFRVLALSATPGNTINDVSEVVHNLLISHLEFRTEESPDVQQYVFDRSLETVVVQLDRKLLEIKQEYLTILEQYAKTLIKFKIIQGNCGSLTKGKIFMLMKDFQNKNRGTGSSNYSEIMRCLNICITLYHAFELLIRHGLRNFLSFFDEHIEKPLLRGNVKLKYILENVRNYLGPIPNIEVLPDGTYPEVPKDIKFGHPKHYKLRDILVSHFSGEEKNNSRVIVFFEYRESVMEAHTLLLQSRPLVQPKIFLGQGAGITQKTQIGVVKAFREGKCNTLLSTCIGEEGLDVGEVDLIVCFDISNKSPIRMVQRMGRTGRRRAGSVLVLVTEGKEQQTLKDCLIHKNNISAHVLGSVQLNNYLYKESPRLVPTNLTPRCEKMFITVKDITKKNNILEKLKKAASSSNLIFTQSSDVAEYRDFIPETTMKCFTDNPIARSNEVCLYIKHIEKMRTAQKIYSVEHSEYTTILNDLLRYADAKRFNIPIRSQYDTDRISGKSLKQGDIRSMFLKESACVSLDDNATQDIQKTSSQGLKYEMEEKIVLKSTTSPIDQLFKLLSNYLVSDLTNELSECPYCNQDFNCDKFSLNSNLFINDDISCQISVPPEEIINEIDLTDIKDFIMALDGSFYTRYGEMFDDLPSDSQFVTHDKINVVNPEETIFTFQAPDTYLKLKETFKDFDVSTQEYFQADLVKDVSNEILLTFFRLESLSDIYASIDNSSQSTIVYSLKDESDKHDLSGDDKSRHIPTGSPVNSKEEENKHEDKLSDIDISELCDLSYFGLTKSDINKSYHLNKQKNIDIESKCYSVADLPNSVDNHKRELISVDNNKTFIEHNKDSPTVGMNKKKVSNNSSEETKLNYYTNSPKIAITQMLNLFDEPKTGNSCSMNNTTNFDISKEEPFSILPPKSFQQVSKSNGNLADITECNTNDSKSNFQEFLKPTVSSPIIRRRKRVNKVVSDRSKCRTKYNEFLDTEAQVSEDESFVISDDEEHSYTDTYEKSFVNDVTQGFDTQMHGVYLQSIRSPARRKPFQRRKPIVDIADVYSQLPPTEESEYLQDSFCVDADDEDLTEQGELSELDILERQLEQKKKRKRPNHAISGPSKRKRIHFISSDESD